MSGRTVLYLSASITNAPLNARLRAQLDELRFELVLPQEFAPLDRSHPTYPRAIYQRCIDEMERCDAALLLLDAFGVDCASEAGWLCARGKPLIGIAAQSLRFLQHWMVKGNLSAVISLDPVVHDAVLHDPILREVDARCVVDPADLGDAIAALVRGHQLQAAGQPARFAEPVRKPSIQGGQP